MKSDLLYVWYLLYCTLLSVLLQEEVNMRNTRYKHFYNTSVTPGIWFMRIYS